MIYLLYIVFDCYYEDISTIDTGMVIVTVVALVLFVFIAAIIYNCK